MLSQELIIAALDDFESFDEEEELFFRFVIDNSAKKGTLAHHLGQVRRVISAANRVRDCNGDLADEWLSLRNTDDFYRAMFKTLVLGKRSKLYSHSWR